jgi:sugar (pentulose or hexulose) kinase
LALKEDRPELLGRASTMLLIPSLMGYYLTGNIYCDTSQASPTLLLDPVKMKWNRDLLSLCNLPDILPPLNYSGEILGKIDNKKFGLTGQDISVVTVPGHDSAVVTLCIPNNKQENAYISSGTWSVIGVNRKSAVLVDEAFENGFTNQLIWNDDIMFVKTFNGLFTLQECQKEWSAESTAETYEELIKKAEKEDFNSRIDPEDTSFLTAENMTQKIIEYCKKTNQAVPVNHQQIFIAIINGIAEKYKEATAVVERLCNQRINNILMVGGGAKNQFKCQRTADVMGKTVIAGPYEAAVIGNMVAQLVSIGEIKNEKEADELILRSFEQIVYHKKN